MGRAQGGSWRLRRAIAALAGVAALAVLGILHLEASYPQVSPLDFELDGPGINVDDPCFWVDPTDPSHTLIFVTSKGSRLVEVFDALSGGLVATIPGFVRPNNCAVEGDLLLTTDRDGGDVKVHAVPDLALIGTFGADMVRPFGIDVLARADGERLVYVTDEPNASVHVYDLLSGGLVRAFPTGFGAGIEPIMIDDRYERVFVARGENEPIRGIGLFTADGVPLGEFGAHVFAGEVEGIALYACGEDGYLIVVDQRLSAAEFELFDRVTLQHLGTFQLDDGAGDRTNATDGIDVLQTPVPGFPYGMLAACDGCGDSLPDEMDVVAWERIAAVMGLNLCPHGGPPDCSRIPCTERVVVSGDVHVRVSAGAQNLGAAAELELERDPSDESRILLRFDVPDLGAAEVIGATLRLTVVGQDSAGGDDGGALYRSAGEWREDQVTYATQPAPVGASLGSAGPVQARDAVDFDLTGVVDGPGRYDFVLLGASTNKVRYYAREAERNPPALLLRTQDGSVPAVRITAPRDGAVFEPGASITFSGSARAASDSEEDDLTAAIRWISDRDGPLGTGGAISTTALRTSGLHTVDAIVTDGRGRVATDSVSVRIDARPTVTIFGPDDGSLFELGEALVLAATARDVEDGDLTPTLVWISRLDGVLGAGGSVTVTTLRSGRHTIAARVADASGQVGSSQVAVTVNSSPRVEITAPGAGAVVATDRLPLLLSGRATDLEDGDLSSAIRWDSSLDGVLGVGAGVPATLSVGTHVVSAAVEDAARRTARVETTVTVRLPNAPPALRITRPLDGGHAPAGTAVLFEGAATDDGDGDLSAAIRWVSDQDGVLGTGAMLSVVLAEGTHTVTASAVDSEGATGAVAVTVIIGPTPPEVVILAPADGTRVRLEQVLALAATAVDATDGDLSRAIVWVSDLDGPLGTGAALTVGLTSSGRHVITANATDAGGLVGRAEIGVHVNTPPEIVIQSPAAAAVLLAGRPSLLTATATDAEDGDLAAGVVWQSDTDGVLGMGAAVTAELSPGVHVITAAVADSDGTATQARVEVTARAAVVEVRAVADTYVDKAVPDHAPGAEEIFRADASPLRIAYLRFAVPDVAPFRIEQVLLQLTVGPDSSHASESGGTVHAIADGSWSETTTTFRTRPLVDGAPLATAGVAASGSPVEFDVTAAVRGGGDRSFAITTATGDAVGYLSREAGAGGPLLLIALGSNATLAVEITQPPAEIRVPVGESSTFEATAIDAEDGDVTDSLVWTSDLDGVLGTGPVVVSALSHGTHIVVATAADGDGLEAQASVVVRVVSPPVVSIAVPDNGTVVLASALPLLLQGRASDAEDGDASPAIVWTSDRDGFLGTGAAFTAGLSVGLHTLTATVTDSDGLVGRRTVGVRVRLPNVGPVIVIASPVDGGTVPAGAAVPLVGTATDDFDGELSVGLVWTSDVDGSLGRGASLTVLPSEGTHTIAAEVTDSDGVIGSARARLVVTATPPSVEIDAPMESTVVTSGQPVTLRGTATDATDGDLAHALVWTSDLDGVLGTGPAVIVSALSTGVHTVTAAVSDSGGLVGSAGVRIRVNAVPAVTIFQPEDGAAVLGQQALLLRAVAFDPEDGNLDETVTWTSSVDGALGTGALVTVPGLTPGAHIVTARAADADGAVAMASVALVARATMFTLTAEADTYVDAETPTVVHGGESTVKIDADPRREALLRFVVPEMAPFAVASATLRLTVGPDSNHASVSGGTVHVVADQGWSEATTTFASRPIVDGPALASAGAVARAQAVDFDVSAAVNGPGIHGFGMLTRSSDGVVYRSREAAAGQPLLVVTLRRATPPVVTIVAPAPDAVVRAGEALGLVAIATDAEDGDLSAAIMWRSDLNGALGSGAMPTVMLEPGLHTLTAEVTDADGRSGREDVRVRVDAPPVLEIVSPADGSRVELGTGVQLLATASDAEDGDLSGRVVWTSDLEGTLGSGASVVADELRSGVHLVRARVADGAGNVTMAGVTVVMNATPLVAIVAPGEGATVSARASLTLAAVASDVEEGDLSASIGWQSDRDGLLGTGGTVAAMLSPGTHVVTATVTDRSGGRGTATVTVTVLPLATLRFAPVADAFVVETSPDSRFGGSAHLIVNGSGPAMQTFLRFEVRGLAGLADPRVVLRLTVDGAASAGSTSGGAVYAITDTGWGELLVTYATRPALEGPVVATAGAVLPRAVVEWDVTAAVPGDGTYVFALVSPVADSAVYRSRESSTGYPELVVTAVGTINAAPEIAITEPVVGAVVVGAAPVVLAASAEDTEDGDLGAGIVWHSDRQGALGTGARLTVGNLEVGMHSIRASVVDRIGTKASASITLRVDGPPLVAIVAPGGDATVSAGAILVLAAVASDAEEGDLSAGIGWQSDRDGSLGTGGTVAVMLSVGTHLLTAAVTDSLGTVGTATVAVTVMDAPPVVTIVSPAGVTTVVEGDAVMLRGTAMDTAEGDLGAGLGWTSSLDGLLGTGASVTAMGLRVGTHVVTATVTDGSGGRGTATVTVTVLPLATLRFAPVADAFVVETSPDSRFGGSAHLIVNGSGPAMQTFLRFEVRGLAGLADPRVVLRLTVDGAASAGSTSGGAVYAITDTGWGELLVTYATRPALEGPVVATAGAVLPRAVVEWDVTAAVPGDGTYVFALVSPVADSAVYRSREASTGPPELVATPR